MRQGQQQQQNRRGRGRGGRKGANPLSRSFESSGPDVKIRGTAQHIAEKYMTLARDAIGSGDLVLGENYLQHAEHYNRIIMAAQQASPGDAMNGNGQRVARHDGDLLPGESYDDDDGDDGDGDQPGDTGNGPSGSMEQPASFEPQNQEQPRSQGYQGQRDQQRFRDRDQGQNRQRDSRPYEPRNFDNRQPREPKHFEPRGQGGDRSYQPRGYDNRNRDNRSQDGRNQDGRGLEGRNQENRNQDNRGNDYRTAEAAADPRANDQRALEPRPIEQRPINGHGEQPSTFDAPPPPVEAVEARTDDATTPEARAPRTRRRRPRHDGAQREFGAPDAPFGGDEPAASDGPAATPAPERGTDEPAGT